MGGIVSKKKDKTQQQQAQQQAEAVAPEPPQQPAASPLSAEPQEPPHLAADDADDASSSSSSSDSSEISSESSVAAVAPPSAAPPASHSRSQSAVHAADSLESPALWPAGQLRVVITPCESPTSIAVEPFQPNTHNEEEGSSPSGDEPQTQQRAEVKFEEDAEGESPVAAAHQRMPSQSEEQKTGEEAPPEPMSITVTDSDAATAGVAVPEPPVAVASASSSSSEAESETEDDALPPPTLTPTTAEASPAVSDPARVFHPHPPEQQNGRPWSATVTSPPRQPARATHARSASAARRPQRPTRPTHQVYRSALVQPASADVSAVVASAWPFPDEDGDAYDETEERFDTEDDPFDSAAHVSSPYLNGSKPHAPNGHAHAHAASPSIMSPRTARLRGRVSPSRRPATASPSMSARTYSLLQRMASPPIVNPVWDSSAPPPLPRPNTAFSQRDGKQQRGGSPHRGAPGSARSYAASVHSSPFGKPVPGAFRDPSMQQHHAHRPSSSPHRRGASASVRRGRHANSGGSHDATANLAAFLHSPESAAAASAGHPASSSSVRPTSGSSPSRGALHSSVQDWSRLVNDLSGTAGDVQANAAARAVDEAERLLRTAKELARRAAVQAALDRARPVVRARTLAEDLALAEQAMAMESEAAVLRAERAALLAASVRAGKLKHRAEKKEEAKYALIVQQEKDALAARKEQVMKEAQERRAATVPRPATAKKKKKQTPKKRTDPAVSELIDGSVNNASHRDARSMPSHHHSSGHHLSPERAPAAVSEAPVSTPPVEPVARAESVSPSHSMGVPSPANTHVRTLSKSSSLPAAEMVNPAHTAPAVAVAPASDSHSTLDVSAAANALLVREEDDYADDTTAEDDVAFGPLSYPLRPQSSKRSRPASSHFTVAPLPQPPQPAAAASVSSRPPHSRTLQLSWDVPRLLVREPTPPIEPQPRLSELQVHAHWPGDNDETDNDDAVPLAPSAGVAAAAAPAFHTPLAGAAPAANSSASVDLTPVPPSVTELATPQPATVLPLSVSPPARDHGHDMQPQPQLLSPTAAAVASVPSHLSPTHSASAVATVSSVAASEAQVSQLSAAIETLSRVIAQQRPGSAGGHAGTAVASHTDGAPLALARSAPAAAVETLTPRSIDHAGGAPMAELGSTATQPASPQHETHEQQPSSPSTQTTSPAAVVLPSRRASGAVVARSSRAGSRPSSRPVSRPVSLPASPRAIVQAAPAPSVQPTPDNGAVLRSAAVPPASVAHDDFSGPAEDVVIPSPRSSRHSISRSRPTSAVSRPQSAAQSRRKSNSKSKNKSKAKRGPQKQKEDRDQRPVDEQHRHTDETTVTQPDVAAAVAATSRPRTPVAVAPPVVTSDAPAAESPAGESLSTAVDLASDGPALPDLPSAAAVDADPGAPVAIPEFVAARTAPPPAPHFSPVRASSAIVAVTPAVPVGLGPQASASIASARPHPAAGKLAHKPAVQPRSRKAGGPAQTQAVPSVPVATPSSPSQSRRAAVSASRSGRRGSKHAHAPDAGPAADARAVSPANPTRASASIARSSVSLNRPAVLPSSVAAPASGSRSRTGSCSRSHSRDTARVDDSDEFDSYGADALSSTQPNQSHDPQPTQVAADGNPVVHPSSSTAVAAAVSPAAAPSGPSDLTASHLAALLHSAEAASSSSPDASSVQPAVAEPASAAPLPPSSSAPAVPSSDDDYTSDDSESEDSSASESSGSSARDSRAAVSSRGRPSVSSSVVAEATLG